MYVWFYLNTTATVVAILVHLMLILKYVKNHKNPWNRVGMRIYQGPMEFHWFRGFNSKQNFISVIIICTYIWSNHTPSVTCVCVCIWPTINTELPAKHCLSSWSLVWWRWWWMAPTAFTDWDQEVESKLSFSLIKARAGHDPGTFGLTDVWCFYVHNEAPFLLSWKHIVLESDINSLLVPLIYYWIL